MRFSIIIPTYNSAQTLSATLESIICQTEKDFEIVIVDADSTDATLKMIEEYNGKYNNIKWTSERDKGIYDAMNKGAASAAGEWLLFLGSDDTLYDCHVLNDVYNTISKNTVDILYGNIIINGETGWGYDKQVYDKEFTLSKLLQKNIAHQAIFYSRKVFQKVGAYNLKYKICADYDFNLRVASRYKMYYLDRIITTFNAGGISTNRKDLPFENDFEKNVLIYFRSRLFTREFISL